MKLPEKLISHRATTTTSQAFLKRRRGSLELEQLDHQPPHSAQKAGVKVYHTPLIFVLVEHFFHRHAEALIFYDELNAF